MKHTLLILTALSSVTLAADWPTWRGPKRDDSSTEKNLLTEWPADGPALAWKTTGCGAGYSSVSVANGRVFTMGDGPDGSSVRAFEEKSGKPLWVSALIGKPGGNYEGPRCTPTVDGDAVFALAQFGDFVCLDAATGKVHWDYELEDDTWSSPYVVDGKVYIGNEKGVMHIFEHSATKKPPKKVEMRGVIRVTPVAHNGVLYVVTENPCMMWAIKAK